MRLPAANSKDRQSLHNWGERYSNWKSLSTFGNDIFAPVRIITDGKILANLHQLRTEMQFTPAAAA